MHRHTPGHTDTHRQTQTHTGTHRDTDTHRDIHYRSWLAVYVITPHCRLESRLSHDYTQRGTYTQTHTLFSLSYALTRARIRTYVRACMYARTYAMSVSVRQRVRRTTAWTPVRFTSALTHGWTDSFATYFIHSFSPPTASCSTFGACAGLPICLRMRERDSVCMYICMYVCMYVYLYVCLCVCERERMGLTVRTRLMDGASAHASRPRAASCCPYGACAGAPI
jgi:hypothetical protein